MVQGVVNKAKQSEWSNSKISFWPLSSPFEKFWIIVQVIDFGLGHWFIDESF